MGSELAGGGKDSQQTQPKTKKTIVRTGRPVSTEQPSGSSAQEIDERFLLGCESTNERTGRPVYNCVPVSVERLGKDKDADENVDADQVRTERPVGSEQSIDLFTRREDIDIDFRVSGLPHAVVKQAENFRVRELVQKIESHPHRQALQAHLQQGNAYTPFSEKSKKMIRDWGMSYLSYAKQFPKVQCSECLLYWNQGIVYCTCGHLLRENKSIRHLHRWQWDILSIPNYVIKKERPHGNRHGKTEAQKEHFIAHNARKRCIKKNFTGIHDRFQKDSRYRDSQLRIGWTEEKCIEMDELAQKDFTYRPSTEEFERYKKNWYISLNTSGRNAPMKLRSDFQEAVTTMNRLHRESGEERPEPIPLYHHQRWHSSSSLSSTSWWQWSDHWWSSLFFC